jgi:hypothetical protein
MKLLVLERLIKLHFSASTYIHQLERNQGCDDNELQILIFSFVWGTVKLFARFGLQGSSASTRNLDHHIPYFSLEHLILSLSLPT